jgi:hypothetical protein
MTEIVLTEEQARVLAGADKPVVVRGPDGVSVGVLDPRDARALARARQRAANPSPYYYTSASVTASLDALQAERDRIGPFTAEYAHEFVRKLEEADPEKYGPRQRE